MRDTTSSPCRPGGRAGPTRWERLALVAPALAAVLVLIGPGAGRAADADAQQPSVRISSFAYQPSVVHVKRGATVRWVNEDDEEHTVTADDNAFRSRGLETHQGYSFKFERAGRFPYHCALHPQMTGTVEVE